MGTGRVFLCTLGLIFDAHEGTLGMLSAHFGFQKIDLGSSLRLGVEGLGFRVLSPNGLDKMVGIPGG